MNDDVTKTDWDVLGKSAVSEVLEWTKGVKEFVADQAPEFVREILAWGFWSNLVWAFIAAIIAVALTVVTVKLIRFALTSWDYIYQKDLQIPVILGYMVLAIASIVFTISSCTAVYKALYVHIAPRMYLIEYLKELTQ